MPVTIDNFDEAGEFGPVTKFERTVKTPMPANPDGSGYTTEENRQVVYSIGEYLIKVSKVSTRGWSVTRYEGEDIDKMDTGYLEDEDNAHAVAREMVEEVAE